MTVGELILALSQMPNNVEVKLSGDSAIYGDGCTMFDPEQGPGIKNISTHPYAGGECVVIWPDRDGWPS